MIEAAISDKLSAFAARKLTGIRNSETSSRRVGLAILIIGTLIWIGLQTGLSAIPLWTRALPPEPDDTLTYILKTKQMEMCPKQECRALRDLSPQLRNYTADQDANVQRDLAFSRIYPRYHPLLSAMIIGLSTFGLTLMQAYKIIWTVTPLFMGIGFAYLLASMWGRAAAGLAMLMMAFKVFPDSGIHNIVPSNLALCIALYVWARITATQGGGLITALVGSGLMIAMHPVGRLYALIAAAIAVAMPKFRFRGKKLLALLGIVALVALAFLIFAYFRNIGMVRLPLIPRGDGIIMGFLNAAIQNAFVLFLQIERYGPGMFGSLAVWLGLVVLGVCVSSQETRLVFSRFFLFYMFFFVGLLFVQGYHPGDIIFRVWAPPVFVLFGAVGTAVAFVIDQALDLFENRERTDSSDLRSVHPALVLTALAVIAGYMTQTAMSGSEQIYATMLHAEQRQPLDFRDEQVQKLLNEAEPEDRVLYDSMIIMPFYFSHGAMKLGAVYYHPSFVGDPTAEEWLNRQDIRFAVTYNPTVYHPSYEGRDENNQWLGSPDFRYSPLSTRRTGRPISREGWIPTDEYRALLVTPRTGKVGDRLQILYRNRGGACALMVHPVRSDGNGEALQPVRVPVPARSTGRVTADMGNAAADSYRIEFPGGRPKLSIGGVVFGDDPNRWPWRQKATITFVQRGACDCSVTRSFDAAKMLPQHVRKFHVTVLDDAGSSVLFRIDR